MNHQMVQLLVNGRRLSLSCAEDAPVLVVFQHVTYTMVSVAYVEWFCNLLLTMSSLRLDETLQETTNGIGCRISDWTESDPEEYRRSGLLN